MKTFLLLSLSLCTLLSEQVTAWSTSPLSGLKLPVQRHVQTTKKRNNNFQRRSSGTAASAVDYDNYWGQIFLNASVGGQPQELYIATSQSDTQVFASKNLAICSFGERQCDHGIYNYSASPSFSNLTDFPAFSGSVGNQTVTGYYFNDTLSFNGVTLDNFTMALLTFDNASWSLPTLGLGPVQAESYSYSEGSSYTYPGKMLLCNLFCCFSCPHTRIQRQCCCVTQSCILI